MTRSGHSTSAPYDAAVIGAGMIGSSAGRHLAEGGLTTLIIGSPEPDSYAHHNGVFGSHYDEGRITRTLDKDRTWALLAQRATVRYADIQRRSGVQFHDPVGYAWVGPEGHDHAAKIMSVGDELAVDWRLVEGPKLASTIPYFDFAEGMIALREGAPAGWIRPRALVRAQLSLAGAAGADIVAGTAISTKRSDETWTIHLSDGRVRFARKVIVATGAFANAYEVLDVQVDTRVVVETVVLAEVDANQLGDFRGMPSLWCEIGASPTVPHIYLVPPLRYPDGRYYIKMGADFDRDRTVTTHEDVIDYFRQGGSAERGQELAAVVRTLIPSLRIQSVGVKPCVLTYTPHHNPMIDQLDEGLFVAIGGNGAAAKSSDEIGRLAAMLVRSESWPPEMDRKAFAAATC
jgi:sarcosine oxidase